MFVTKSTHEKALERISQLESELQIERSLQETIKKDPSNLYYSLEFAALRLAISEHKPIDPASQLAVIGKYGERKTLLLVEDSWTNLMEAKAAILELHISLGTRIPNILLAMDIEDALQFIASGEVDMVITDLGLHHRGVSIVPKNILGYGDLSLDHVNSLEEFVVGQAVQGNVIKNLDNKVIPVLLHTVAKSVWKSVRDDGGRLVWEDMNTPTLNNLPSLKSLNPEVHGATPMSIKEEVYSLLSEALTEGLHVYSLDHPQVTMSTLMREVLIRDSGGGTWEAVPCAMGLLIVQECDKKNIPVVYHSSLSHSESGILVPIVVGDVNKEEILQIHAKSRREEKEEGGRLLSLETRRGLLVYRKSPYWWMKAWEKLESL